MRENLEFYFCKIMTRESFEPAGIPPERSSDLSLRHRECPECRAAGGEPDGLREQEVGHNLERPSETFHCLTNIFWDFNLKEILFCKKNYFSQQLPNSSA